MTHLKKNILILPFLALSLCCLSGCGEEQKPQRSAKNALIDKKDNLYRNLARQKEDIMSGNLKGWRARLDAVWVHGEIIDSQMAEYITEIKRIALQMEAEEKDGRLKSDLTVEPKIDENIAITEEILTAYLMETLKGVEAQTLVRWKVVLDKVYLHGKKLNEKHYKIIEDIERKGKAFDRARDL